MEYIIPPDEIVRISHNDMLIDEYFMYIITISDWCIANGICSYVVGSQHPNYIESDKVTTCTNWHIANSQHRLLFLIKWTN